MEIYLSKSERFHDLEVDSSISLTIDTSNEKDVASAEKMIQEFYGNRNIEQKNISMTNEQNVSPITISEFGEILNKMQKYYVVKTQGAI